MGEEAAVYWLRSVEMDGHGESVNAGVGTSCGDDGDRRAKEGGKSVLYDLLYGDSVGLDLEAVIAGAVVGEIEEVSGHEAGES